MPIEVDSPIDVLDQEEFHALAKRVLRVVFDVHNSHGRFLDELLFKREIAAQGEACGLIPTRREVRVSVTHQDYRHDYRIDLLCRHSLLIEAKTAEALAPAHRSQTLNYLFLTGLQHALLLNLRPERVQHDFVSTTLTHAERHRFTVVDEKWLCVDEQSRWFHQQCETLLADWGAFLEVSLYRDAVTHFLGGKDRVVCPVPVFSGERVLGEQPVHLLTPDTAFAVTAVTGDARSMADHQRRFLRHTPLRFVQWVNLNHHQIEFRTLTKDPTHEEKAESCRAEP